jgi:CheY-like chemotaxis protein
VVVTARGFAAVAAKKMLVMIDGRTVYSPPAIAVTAYASVSDRASALASGYEAHVATPFEPDALAQTVAMLRRAQIRPS